MIATAAVQNLLGGDATMARRPQARDHGRRRLRDPRRSRAASARGNFFIDDEVLRAEGVTDFSRYAPGGDERPLQGDFFVPDAVFERSPTRIKRGF